MKKIRKQEDGMFWHCGEPIRKQRQTGVERTIQKDRSNYKKLCKNYEMGDVNDEKYHIHL